MTMPFLEESLPVAVRMGAQYSDGYSVEIVTTSSGQEFRRLVHPFPARRFRVRFTRSRPELWDEILSLYHRVYGRFGGFRVRFEDDFSTAADHRGTPAAFDEALQFVATRQWRLTKRYGVGTALTIGRPIRTLWKPVSGSVVVGIRNTVTGDVTAQYWTADTATGLVTFTDRSRAITAITQAASAVVTSSGHPFLVNDLVFISGVAGMTQINNRRALVTARTSTTYTLSLNSSAFSAYTSGGTGQSQPGSTETVHAGCHFDVPCRFDSDVAVEHISADMRETAEIDLVELITP